MVQYGTVSSGSIASGYCSLPCGTGSKPNNSCTITNSSYFTSFACNAGFTKDHLTCIDNNNLSKGALHYGGPFKSGTINISVNLSATNYYVEFWIYVDKVFTPSSSKTTNYIWVTNSISIGRSNDYSVNNTYKVLDYLGNTYGSAFTYEFGQWYKISYYISGNSLTYVVDRTGTQITDTISNSISTPLTNINFCNGVTCGPFTAAIDWASGYYRNIRVWDGTNIPLVVYKQFDRYWSFFNNMTRFTAMYRFYPLTLQYTMEKVIKDPDLTPTGDVTASGTVHPFQPWNYSITFDQTTSTNYITNAFTTEASGLLTPVQSACGSNCSSCNVKECFVCNAGYWLANGACTNNAQQKYYLLTPAYSTGTSTAADVTFNAVAGVTTSFTCSFFIKMLSWKTSSSSFDIFRYGSGMKLTYSINAKTLILTDGTNTFSTFINFYSLFGQWINISFSYFYDSTINSYYPAMINFQVNFQSQVISGTISNISVNNMVIPKEPIALYAKLWVSSKYTTGAWSEISKTGRLFSSSITKFIDDGSSTTNCVTGLATTVDLTCVVEYDAQFLDETNWCTAYSMVDKINTPGCQTAQAGCKYGFYTSGNLCGCTSDKTIQDNWVQSNSGNNKCAPQDYVDFGQTTSTAVSTIGTGSSEYTMEFWVYINTYVSNSFTGGFELQWDKQLKILFNYNSSLKSTCYPFFDSGDTSFQNLNSVSFTITSASWVYIRCSVSKTLKLFHHFREDLITSENTLSGTGPTIPAQTTLTLKNNSINRGLVYFRQLRLWSCYLCQNPDTYKLEISAATVANFSNLLHLWDPTYTMGATYPGTVTDLKGGVTMPPVVDTTWIGYNVLDGSNYSKLTTSNKLCVETVQAQSCTGLIKMNQVKDVSIQAQPGRRGRYTIELWMMVTSLTNLTNGFHVLWKDLVSLSFVKNASTSTTMDTYCWPQDYRINLQSTNGAASLSTLASSTLNYDSDAKTSYTDGTWMTFRCAVSFNMETFYYDSNSVKVLKPEVLYNGQATDTPWRNFWGNNENTNFIVAGANKNSNVDIYIRQVYLFNDFIPQAYSFSYHELTKITSSGFPSLIFSVTFYGYWKQLNKVIYNTDTLANQTYNPIVVSTPLTYTSGLLVKTNCDPTGKLKYSTESCSPITSCNLASLFANYCLDENKPLSCATNYFWDGDAAAANASTACQTPCTGKLIRSPDSAITSGICNFDCKNSMGCPKTLINQRNLPNNYVCNTGFGFTRYGYKCLQDPTAANSYLYFNGCQKFPNIGFDFQSGPGTKMQNGYTLQFWMRIDRLNEFCSIGSKTKYYFVAEPHTIYLDTTSTTIVQTGANVPANYYNIVYQHASTPTMKGTLLSFNPSEWNLITIHVNLLVRSLRVYSNSNFLNPDLKFDNVSSSVNLNIGRMLWCSTYGSQSDNTLCSSYTYASNMFWGAAFYKDIKVMDGANANPWLMQASDSKLFSDSLSTFYYYFPMTLITSLDYNIKNILSLNNEGINYLNRYTSSTTIISSDGDQLINYSSKFEFAELNPGKYTSSIDPTSGAISNGTCSIYCKKCVNNSTTGCIQCLDGSVSYANTCKKYSGYYLKLPLTNVSNTYLSLNVQDQKNIYYLAKENMLTFTIWIKYFGHLTTTPCIVLFRLKSDGTRNICYNPSTRTLNFYEGSNILYQDDKVFNSMIGQWMLISFTTFSDVQNAIPNLGNYFKALYAFYSHNKEITKNPNFGSAYPTRITFDSFDIGYEFSGLLADLRFYRDFILNPYGFIYGAGKGQNVQYFPFAATTSSGLCITDSNLNLPFYSYLKNSATQYYINQLGITCVPDYVPYFDATCGLQNFYDITQYSLKDPPCSACSQKCKTNCGSTDQLSCTTDFNSATDWLKLDSAKNIVYGETPLYTEFSQGTLRLDNIKAASLGEYTTEFWFYIYSYNNTNIAFDSHEVVWDLHNYIKIYNNGQAKNNLSVRCSPVYDDRNRTIYIGPNTAGSQGTQAYGFEDIYQNSNSTAYGISTGGFYRWSYVQCSSSIPRKLYYLNQNGVNNINYPDYNIPSLNAVTSTSLFIQPGSNSKTNYGFLFIRELKLWSQYEIRKFTTQCRRTTASLSYYSTLLHYFENNNQGQIINDLLNHQISGGVLKRSDFIGYNLISLFSNNDLLFPSLDECGTMNVYPSTGMVNVTTFNFESRELQQAPTNTYNFYYRVKDSDIINQLGNSLSNREISNLFKFPFSLIGAQIGSSNSTMLLDVYCDVVYGQNTQMNTNKQMTLYVRMKLYAEVSFAATLDYNNILSTMDLNDQITNQQLLDRVKVLNDLQSDLKDYSLGSLTTTNQNNTSENNFNNSTNGSSNSTSNIDQSTILPNGKQVVQVTPSCDNDHNHCNNRGVCYSIDINLFCQCFNGYKGDNCQLNLNNSITWIDTQSKMLDMFNYRLSNYTTFQVDSSLIQSVTTLFNSTSNLISNVTDLIPFQNIMKTISDYSSQPNYNKDFSAAKQNLFAMADTMYKLNIKTTNLQKYENFNQMLISGDPSIKSYNYTVKYFDLNNIIVTNTKMRQLQLDQSLLSDANKTYVLQIQDASDLTLADSQKSYMSKSMDNLKNYLQTVSMGIFNTSLNQDLDFTYNSVGFKLVLKKITDANNFNFIDYFNSKLNKSSTYDAYFDATDCLNEFIKSLQSSSYNLTNIFLFYIEYKISDKFYNPNLLNNVITTSHEIFFYDNNINLVNLTCSSGIVHYLPMSINKDTGFISNYTIYPSKYTKSGQGETDLMYYPAFIFSNGTIDRSPLLSQQTKYYRNYNVTVNYFDKTSQSYNQNGLQFQSIETNGYVIAKSFLLSQFTGFAYFSPIRTPHKNNYFFDFQQIYRCVDNVRGNMCFYIVILFFAFHFLTIFSLTIVRIFQTCCKVDPTQEEIEADMRILRNDNERVEDNRIPIYSLRQVKAVFKQVGKLQMEDREMEDVQSNMEVVPKIKTKQEFKESEQDQQLVMSDNKKLGMKDADAEGEEVRVNIEIEKSNNQKIKLNQENELKEILEQIKYPSNKRFYNLFHFVLFRNIYSNVIVFRSPLMPKYKSFSKVPFLVSMILLTICTLCTFIDMDLSNFDNVDKSKIVGFIFISVFASNFALLFVSLIFNTGNKTKGSIVLGLTKDETEKKRLLRNNFLWNIGLTVVMNMLTIALEGLLYYFSVGFCTVWVYWAHNLLIVWLIALLTDFLIMEICLECFIFLVYMVRNSWTYFELLYRMLVWLKNLRNCC